MPTLLPHKRLSRIARSTSGVVKDWQEGVSLEQDSHNSIDDLLRLAAVDRWRLAARHRSDADLLLKLRPPHFRGAIGRYYYSMYHAMRACAFLYYRGDDYQEHTELPRKIPSNFPNADWESKLKNVRETRNRADYDPYPKPTNAWRKDAETLGQLTEELLKTARLYLRGKGCSL